MTRPPTLNVGRVVGPESSVGRLRSSLWMKGVRGTNWMLDLEFYRQYYNDMTGCSDEEITDHWMNEGLSIGRFPNQFVAYEHVMLNPALPKDFSLESYLEINPDVADAITWRFQGIIHYLTHGVPEGRSYLPSKKAYRDDLSHAEELRAQECVNKPNGKIVSRKVVPDHFNMVSYLINNIDVRQELSRPSDVIDHLMNHGISERRNFAPLHYDTRFILQLYGIKIPSGMALNAAVAFLKSRLKARDCDEIFFSEDEICRYYYINLPYFLETFDHEFYRYKYLNREQRDASRAACMEHFCKIGQFKRYDISADLIFDEEFYRSEYFDEAAIIDNSIDELYRNWITSGSEHPKWPNFGTMAKFCYHVKAPICVKKYVSNSVFFSKNAGSYLRPSDVLKNLFNGNLVHPDVISVSEAGFDYFYTTVADRLSLNSRFNDAEDVYLYVIRHYPAYSRALNHRADQAQRLGDLGLAIDARLRIIEIGAGNEWTFVNLAQCLLDVGEAAHAVSILKKGVVRFPSDVGLKIKLQDYQQKYFAETWTRAPQNALNYGYRNEQILLEKCLGALDGKTAQLSVPRSVHRVAIYANCDLQQCNFYRIDQRREQLKFAGYEVEVYNYSTMTKDFIENLLNVDFVIVYRVPAFPDVIHALNKARALGLRLLYDIDDLIFDARYFPPSLESYAGHIDAEQHAAMACGVTLFAHTITLCDAGMASTQSLMNHLRDKVASGIAFHLPNALSATHYMSMDTDHEKDTDFVKIFYGSATKAHKEDFQTIIEPALAKLFDLHGDTIRLVLVGDIALSPTLNRWANNILVRKPTESISNYWDVLKECDINLSILSADAFNDAKSEIKWMEAAMFGIPSVVSATQTYRDVIRNGETGILCETSDDFFVALRDLVSSNEMRSRIGAAARDDVMEKYGVREQSIRLKGIIDSIACPATTVRKKLVVVNVFYPPQAIGGATRVVHDNVKALRAILGDAWQIDVICTLEGGPTPYALDWYVHDGVRVFCITAANHPSIDHFVEDKIMGEVFDRVIENIGPDIVHFHCIQRLTTSCVDAVAVRNIPFLITMHDGWWISPYQFLLNDDKKIETYDFVGKLPPERFLSEVNDRARVLRKCLGRAARVLTVSNQFGDICRQVGVKNVEVIENGVSPLPVIARTRSPSGRVRLGFIGGAAAHKGYNLIRNVVVNERFANLSLLVIDHAMHPNDVINDVWGNTPVEIRGKRPQSQIDSLYAKIDVLLAPSVWPESYGLVTREAAILGCWVVASDRGAVSSDLVEGENGYIVNVDDESGLFKALKYIDENPEKHLVSPSLKIDIRTSEQQAVELSEVYREVVDAHSQARRVSTP